MSVMIRGMEMPKSCDICPFMKTNDDLDVEDYRYMYCDFPGIGEFVTDYEASRHPYCPLIEVPVPHGRLIDAEPILEFIQDGLNSGEFGNDVIQVMTEIQYAPTIIEAEVSE